MNYKQIKLTFKYSNPKRFYRTLLTKQNVNLIDLGCAIVTAFGGEFEHLFLFETKTRVYNPKCFMEDMVFENDVLMDNYTLSDLGDNFIFTYDTGDGWNFSATVTDSDVEEKEEDFILIDGAGQGIWEDNIHTLKAYLDGKIDPNTYEPDENNGYYPPWNFENEKYGDFDNFNLEEEKQRFIENYPKDIISYKEGENRAYNDEALAYEEVELDDEEELPNGLFNSDFYNILMALTKDFIKEIPFVNDVYNKLLVNHKPKEAKELIVKEFLFLNFQNAKNEKPFDFKKFEKALKKII